MQFDIADANNYQGQHLFDDIVMHEMLHSVGFGSIWSYKGLIAGSGTSTPTFTGLQAMSAYHTLVPGSTGGVPLEQDGGSGTAESHWDEQTFTSELMTGYIGYVDSSNIYHPNDTFSYMTVASLGDLGYSIVGVNSYTAPDFIT